MREVLPAEMVLALIRWCQPDKVCAFQWFVSIMEKEHVGSAGNGTGGTNLPSQDSQHSTDQQKRVLSSPPVGPSVVPAVP